MGNILQFYNTDKMINLYGFGGQVNPYDQKASHCFALNGDIFNPRVNGIQEVIQYYSNALNACNLYGPTYFNEVLNEFVSKAESAQVSQHNQVFHIMVIITDGVIGDMQKTIDQIVRGSDQPCSVIIVGVGDANFEAMD